MRVIGMFGLVGVAAMAAVVGCQLVAGVRTDAALVSGGGAGGNGGQSQMGGAGGMGGNAGTGGIGGMGGGGAGGSPADCIVDADCPNNECRTDGKCNNKHCEWTFLPDSTLAASQLYGDCLIRKCDGQGAVGAVSTDPGKDIYDWGDPCYLDACNPWQNPMPDDDKNCATPWGKAGTCKDFKCIECVDATTCGGGECVDGKCVPTHCTTTIKDGNETDVDCGGACTPCAVDLICAMNADCAELGKCDTLMGAGKCLAPSCTDGIKDGDETDIDCGGKGACASEIPAKKCSAAAKCLLPEDCESGVCISGTCFAPNCNDAVQNGDEAGIDCGGASCAACAP